MIQKDKASDGPEAPIVIERSEVMTATPFFGMNLGGYP